MALEVFVGVFAAMVLRDVIRAWLRQEWRSSNLWRRPKLHRWAERGRRLMGVKVS